MEAHPAKLPDLSEVDTAEIAGYSLDPDGSTVRLWIHAGVDAVGPVRVFFSESEGEVHVVVVPTPAPYHFGYAGWSEDEIAADVADVVARLSTPLGSRHIIDGKTGQRITALPKWIQDRREIDPAPAERPVGHGSQNDPLTFRGEL